MSESAPEKSSKGGNFWTKKAGPLPMWGWGALGLLAVLMIALFRSKKNAQAASASTVNTPGGVDASLVPQFVNQDYTNVTPPAAPNITINGQVPHHHGPPDHDQDHDKDKDKGKGKGGKDWRHGDKNGHGQGHQGGDQGQGGQNWGQGQGGDQDQGQGGQDWDQGQGGQGGGQNWGNNQGGSWGGNQGSGGGRSRGGQRGGRR